MRSVFFHLLRIIPYSFLKSTYFPPHLHRGFSPVRAQIISSKPTIATVGIQEPMRVSLAECDVASAFIATEAIPDIARNSTAHPCHEHGYQPHPYRLALNQRGCIRKEYSLLSYDAPSFVRFCMLAGHDCIPYSSVDCLASILMFGYRSRTCRCK